MRRIIFFLTIVLLSHSACNTKIKIKKLDANGEYITYEHKKGMGHFINAVKSINNIKIHYNIHLKSNGELINILKYDDKYYGTDFVNTDQYRSLELLVSDTSKKEDPNFFGNSIIGYFSDSITNNVVLKENSKRILTPLSKQEIELFFQIDSLANAKDIKYIQFDTSKVLGWFKYVF